MNYFEEVANALLEFQSLGIQEEDLKICYSPLVARELMKYAATNLHMIFLSHMHKEWFGVEVDNKYPFNHIVIFHKELACYRPELCRIIEIMEWSYPMIENTENGTKITTIYKAK